MTGLKLVLHVDQADRWPAAFSNLTNLARDYPDAALRVVANGSGVYAFIGRSDLLEHFEKFAAKGVALLLCNNALDEHHIERSALPAFVQIVPAGVVALAEAQQEGFAYIKP